MNALQEHAAYSSHYLWGGDQRRVDSDDDYGNISDAQFNFSIRMIFSISFFLQNLKQNHWAA